MDEITFRDGDDIVRLLSNGDVEFYASGTFVDSLPNFVIRIGRLQRILSIVYMLRQDQDQEQDA